MVEYMVKIRKQGKLVNVVDRPFSSRVVAEHRLRKEILENLGVRYVTPVHNFLVDSKYGVVLGAIEEIDTEDVKDRVERELRKRKEEYAQSRKA